MKFIPLQSNSKEPLKCRSWKKTMSSDPAAWQAWLAAGLNIGMPTGKVNGGIMAVDWDDRDLLAHFFRKNRDRIKAMTLTPRGGGHCFFRGEGPNAQGKPDIRGEGGYVLRPPSTIDGKPYRDVPGYELRSVEQLGEFQDMWYPTKEVKTPKPATAVTNEIRNIHRYIRGIKSIQGQHGSDECFRVACLLRDYRFSELEALAEMIAWSQECAEPEWSIKELIHKIQDAYRKVTQ